VGDREFRRWDMCESVGRRGVGLNISWETSAWEMGDDVTVQGAGMYWVAEER